MPTFLFILLKVHFKFFNKIILQPFVFFRKGIFSKDPFLQVSDKKVFGGTSKGDMKFYPDSLFF